MSTHETTAPVAGTPAPEATLPTKPEASIVRLVLTLTLAGALSALLLSVVNELTLPTIQANRAAVLREAVAEVLADPKAVASLRVTSTGLVADDEVQYMEVKDERRVYLGFADEAGREPIGFALVGSKFGYGSDPIKLAFGYDAVKGEVIGLKVLEHKETPGIGTKIETEDSFAGLFWRPVKGHEAPPRQPPLEGRREDQFDAKDAHHVDMISGATISSKAVIAIVNEAVAGDLGEWLKTYMKDAATGNTASEGAE